MKRRVLQVGWVIIGVSILSTASAVTFSRSLFFPLSGASVKGIVSSQSPGTEWVTVLTLSNTARLFETGVNVATASKSCLRGFSGSAFLPINCTAIASYTTPQYYCPYCVDGYVYVITTPLGGDDFTIEVPEKCELWIPAGGGNEDP